MIHYTAVHRPVKLFHGDFCHRPVVLNHLSNLTALCYNQRVRGKVQTRVVRTDRDMATVLGVRNTDGSIAVERVLHNVKIRSKRGTLKPQFANQRSAEHGRRRMSPWQARAIGSGRGVIAGPDTVFTMSPQDVQIGWAASYVSFTGHSTSSSL